MPLSFYKDPQYKLKQSAITKLNWQLGKFDFKKKTLQTRKCQNPKCQTAFKVKPFDPKKFCTHRCASRCTSTIGNKCTQFLSKPILEEYYLSGKAMVDIAKLERVSVHKVVYWMNKYHIRRRPLTEAIYLKNHPNGDPFKFNIPNSLDSALLFGLGLGLYWGEGNKANKTSIRLTNTDPDLINAFMKFLIDTFDIKKEDLRFSLQLFTDIKVEEALDYWLKKLDVNLKQFYKPVITKSNSIGTYRKKSEFGVIIVYYHNRKLRDLLMDSLPKWLSGRAYSW